MILTESRITLRPDARAPRIRTATTPSRDEWSCKGRPMTNYPYLLFNQSPEQLRRIGARGGKAQARNRRARQQAPDKLPPQTLAGIAPLAQDRKSTRLNSSHV